MVSSLELTPLQVSLNLCNSSRIHITDAINAVLCLCRVTTLMAGVSARELRPAAHGTARQAEACLQTELDAVAGKTDRSSKAVRDMCAQTLVEEVLLKQDRVTDAQTFIDQNGTDLGSETSEVRSQACQIALASAMLMMTSR